MVDDEAVVRIAGIGLGKEGYEVDAFGDSSAAPAVFVPRSCDVAFFDLQMDPSDTGWRSCVSPRVSTSSRKGRPESGSCRYPSPWIWSRPWKTPERLRAGISTLERHT